MALVFGDEAECDRQMLVDCSLIQLRLQFVECEINRARALSGSPE